MEKIKTNGKMKIMGYVCYLFAMILSVLAVMKKIDSDIALPLINTWLITGTSLLFGNSAKHAIGSKLLQNSPKGVQ